MANLVQFFVILETKYQVDPNNLLIFDHQSSYGNKKRDKDGNFLFKNDFAKRGSF